MADAQMQAWLDQEDAHTTRLIRRHGWMIEYVSADGPCCTGCAQGVAAPHPDSSPGTLTTSFAYTVGLFGLGHPELLILGVDRGTALAVLNDLGSRIRDGRDLLPGELLRFPEWPHRIVVEELPNPGEVVFATNRHYQRPDAASVPVYQLTYDDKDGRFPWDEGYSIRPDIQPRPGTYTA